MLRVAVFDRGGFHLEAVKTLLASQPDLELVGATSNFEECLGISAAADVALVQQDPQPADTLRMIETLRSAYPATRIVVFGASEDPGVLLDYLEAGARGYASNEDSSEHLLNVVRVAASGEALVGAHLVGALLDRLSAMRELVSLLAEDRAWGIEITPEQSRVAHLVAAGLSDQEISAELDLPPEDIRDHIDRILGAYGVTDRRHAAVLLRLA